MLTSSRATAAQPESQPRSVRVGVYQNKPKVFMDERGQASGVFSELLIEIARAEGWALTFVPCGWTECLEQLEDGRLDLMQDVAYTREREARYDFHPTPAFESWSQFYARPEASIGGLPDLAGKRVAVLRGSLQHTAFQEMMTGFGYDVTIVPTESFEAAFAAVQSGSADVAITNHFFGDYFHRQYGLLRTPIVFQPAQLHYATAEGRNEDLLRAIDRHLRKWRREPNSVYYATLARWMDRPPVRLVPRRIFWIIGVALGLLILAGALLLLLRHQVRAKTRHLVRANEERLRLEAELQQAQKMEAIGKLAGGIAHDFNNLLTVIMSYTDLSLREAKEGDAARQNLTEVASAAQRAAALTRQLLAVSRTQVLELEPVDLNQVATAFEPMLRRAIGEDIDLRVVLAPDLGTTMADPGQLERVIMNLAVNARDAMPAGGQLTIETGNADFDASHASKHLEATPGPFVLLSVTDTGSGMDAATKSRIFEPFFTTKGDGEGTGLGLAIAYGIVKQSGGHIQVDSELGHGTTFRICLPRTSAMRLEAEP